MSSTPQPAHASGQYLIGGDLPVYRLGYGTMQLTGPGHWYHSADPDAAKRLLRRAVASASTISTPPTPTAQKPSSTSSARPCTPTRRVWSSPPRAA